MDGKMFKKRGKCGKKDFFYTIRLLDDFSKDVISYLAVLWR